MISSDAARKRSTVDLTWERAQEKALDAFRTGDAASARANWAKALDIAERHFERGDPRLAASLASHAFALLRQRQVHQANVYFQRAVTAWEDSWCWVPWMTPSTDRDSAEAQPYDRATQEAFFRMIQQAKAITETLWREHRAPEAVGDDWTAVKPQHMGDLRRLFAAVFLLPTAAAGRHMPRNMPMMGRRAA